MRKIDEIDIVITELESLRLKVDLVLQRLYSVQAEKYPPKSAKENRDGLEEFTEMWSGKKVTCAHCGKEMRDKRNKIFGTKKRPLCWIHRCK